MAFMSLHALNRYVIQIALQVAAVILFTCLTMGTSFSQARHALLIGNNAYPSAPLQNALQDAVAMGKTLAKAGYSTSVIQDGTRESMLRAIQQLTSVVAPGDELVFFYAGHGVQFQDRNYLLPVDSKVDSEEDVALGGIDLEELLDLLEKTKPKSMMVILDACRNNPFGDRVPVKHKGLAQPRLPPNTLIVYSTAPGETASDEGDGNGIFVQRFIHNIGVANVSIEAILKTVRSEVMIATKDLQVPWDSSTLTQRLVISRDESVSTDSMSNTELKDRAADLYWESIQSRADLQSLEEFLTRFPTSKNAGDARVLLGKIYSSGDKQINEAKKDFRQSQNAIHNWQSLVAIAAQIPAKSISFLKLLQALWPSAPVSEWEAIRAYEQTIVLKKYHIAIAGSFAQEGVVINVQHSLITGRLAKQEAINLCEYERKSVGDRWPTPCEMFFQDGDWFANPMLKQLDKMTAVDGARFVQLVIAQIKKLLPRLMAS